MTDFKKDLDRSLLPSIEHFWRKLDERTLFQMGVNPSYDDGGEKSLGLDVEYFHYSICADSRYRYLGENIVLNPDAVLTDRNKLCNAVIAHLYGGRRIHTLFSGITDPKRALIDFERIRTDQDYVQHLYENADYAKSHRYKFYGTTELHTSLQTSARNFCRQKYKDPQRAARNTDILEWIGGWIDSGLVDRLAAAPSLDKAYDVITSLPGVGPYYGYHLAVDASLFHFTKFRHDEPFCMPGSGCRVTLSKLFPNLSKAKNFNFGEAVIWIEANQKDLFPNVTFNEALWNIDINGQKLFPFEQDKLMTYGLEVGLCQHSIYCRLNEQPHLVENRKCASDPDLNPIKWRENGKPITPAELTSSKIPHSSLLEF